MQKCRSRKRGGGVLPGYTLNQATADTSPIPSAPAAVHAPARW